MSQSYQAGGGRASESADGLAKNLAGSREGDRGVAGVSRTAAAGARPIGGVAVGR